MQNALNFFYRQLDRLSDLITASAYSQARRKIKPELFIYLRQETLRLFYSLEDPDEQPIATWCGRRLLGGDITMINLPDVPRLRREYTIQRNQHTQRGVVQAAGLLTVDLLNDVVIGGHLLKRAAARQMLIDHALEDLAPEDVIVLDREFGDSGLIAYLCARKQDFIIRVQSTHFLSEVAQFVASGDLDSVIEIAVADKQKAFAREHQLPMSLPVRMIRYDLPSGEIEVLITSLFDESLYCRAQLIAAYGRRWGIETYFNRLKNIFEVERFSSATPQAIEQDFQGMLFLSTLESILTRPAASALSDRSQQRATKQPQTVNRSLSYAALLDTVIELLCDSSASVETVLEQITTLLMKNPRSIRPTQSNKRSPLPPGRQSRYLRYRRRLT